MSHSPWGGKEQDMTYRLNNNMPFILPDPSGSAFPFKREYLERGSMYTYS